MRTIIAGSRGITDLSTVEAAMRECGWWPTAVLSGTARGVDRLGEQWAAAYGIPVEQYPADWDGQSQKQAGHRRNEEMAARCDALVAVWDGASPGTAHMVQTAQALGRRVHVYRVAPAVPVPPPAGLGALRAGDTVPAGLTQSTVMPDLDFETYSEAGFVWNAERNRWSGPPNASQNKKGLFVVGAAAYTEHPTCEVLSLKFDLKDGLGRRHWRPGLPPPADLHAHVAAGGLLEAWNVAFERWVWENVCVPRLGWPPVQPHQWRCAMGKARAHAMPGSLEAAGRVLRLAVQKDADGQRLLDKFSVPRNPTKDDPRTRVEPLPTLDDVDAHMVDFGAGLGAELTPRQQTAALAKHHGVLLADHADTLKLYAYNETDIVAEAEASSVLPDLSRAELRYWQDDQEINHRGVAIDMAGVHDCIAIIEQATRRYGEELQALAGCLPTELKQLQGWLHAQGVHLDSMDADAIDAALDSHRRKPWLPAGALRALEIRSFAGSASVKKVFAMRNQATRAGRLHDLYTYHGARTGRPTGNGPQPTNLPKAGPNVYRCGYVQVDGREVPLPTGGCGRFHGAHTMWCHWCSRVTMRGPKDAREWGPEAAEDALAAISLRSLDYLQLLFGDAMLAVAGVLRALFVASPGHDFLSSDFTAIEGVIIACMAGERWRVDAYANDQPMYLLSAERMFGTSVAEMKAYAKTHGHHHPLRQKGKGGELGLGFGGWINALRQFDVDGTDDELIDVVLKWRAASPAIEWLWGGQTKGAADVVLQNAGRLRGADRWDRTPRPFGLEGMAVMAVQNPGTVFEVDRLDGTRSGIAYLTHNDVLYCRVPSGGVITYHRPRLQPSQQTWRGLQLTFEGWNSNPKKGPPGWITMSLYGCERWSGAASIRW